VQQSTPHDELDLEDRDQRILLHGVSWTQYQAFLSTRGEKSAVRVTYLDGEMELMSPSLDHELIKSMIGRLLEAWALETGVELKSCGSWTVKNRSAKRGAEPDECFVIGATRRPRRPDLAIEVIWSSGGLDKLDVYLGLGVPEVWVWREGAIQVYRLQARKFGLAEKSVLLPGLDLALLATFVERPDQTAAIREFLAALRRRSR
jgi:Uma2 family endonuclease